jgi:hypothetical protein
MQRQISSWFAIDVHVISAALYDARCLVEKGDTPEEAVSKACRGAWSQYRDTVHLVLTNCVSLPTTMPQRFADRYGTASRSRPAPPAVTCP